MADLRPVNCRAISPRIIDAHRRILDCAGLRGYVRVVSVPATPHPVRAGRPPLRTARPAPRTARPAPRAGRSGSHAARLRGSPRRGAAPHADRRQRWPGALRTAALVVALLTGTTACTGLDRASAAGLADEALVSEAADRIAAAGGLTWTTTYRLAGGATARVARSQTPARVAYTWPSGSLISTSEALIRCAGAGDEAVCTATSPGGDESIPASTGLVTPAAILGMLEVAAVDPGTEVVPRETTIAGRYASCLRFDGGTGFEVCVTVEGTVAAFTGTVDGAQVEMLLTDYRVGSDETDFTVPPDARLDDRRPT
ncbi:hypothetical protein BC793_11850 [Actinoplanes xinjiangensis]|uniref:Uncharacterized protein n=1 Tax=Actinoplanes xinjiangensis TaxID=512350 RepID=A0A316F592_9ACTN|nr:hypothetical protein BC793_11850 [Actinoplanes xinjiangensis]